MGCSASLRGDTQTPAKILDSPEREEPIMANAREDPQLYSNVGPRCFSSSPLFLHVYS